MTLAIPIRERNDAFQANCFGFCTCTPSFRRGDATSLLSADTKSPRICTFSSYFKSRIFNARPALSAFSRLTPFACADARYRGWGRAPECSKYAVADRVVSSLPSSLVYPDEGRVSHHRLSNPRRMNVCRVHFPKPFRMNVCVTTGGVGPA